jgi:hypothetical protein
MRSGYPKSSSGTEFMPRIAFAALAIAAIGAPAQAQFYWKPAEVFGPPLLTYEPGMGVPMPDATPAEQKAAIVWNMRAGLNVAALQCGFEPTLRTLENYNAILGNHTAELAASFNTLAAYFKRVNKTPALGQKALDTFGTRTYSGFSTVQSQLEFCATAGRVGRIGLFTPRGSFATFAGEHLRELRNALARTGEQQFRYAPPPRRLALLPVFDEKRCWKKNRYNYACGYST